ncbi:MAG: metallophosphoesterase [Candidatus Thalassarchaeaceae archaeon]|jgi:DNA polymerase II small subunit|nr:metallophosphoesterase [Candidatus Thalassarchaeaceae archaeon]MDP6703556.1 metallophosphoesterase [Candidatus Thalassarchaeaceae archaeon]MDP7004465.1 metallophosphoesterase [Candidatus Thalassarchaeaceae archaeon]
MASGTWQERCQTLAAAGLLAQASARGRIEELPSLLPLIEAANSSGVHLLNESTIDELMAIVPSEQSIEESPVTITSQTTLSESESESPIGRALAPVRSTPPSPPPKPQFSSNYSAEDFPMEARDIDAEIQVHFDITGQSTTEGRLSDIQLCFRSRLSQIRDMMLTSRTLPRRPTSNVEAWRNRQRHNSKDYEITIVGLVSEVRWTRTGKLRFVVEDESAQISCLLNPPSDATPLHPSLDGLMDDEIIGASGYFLSGDRDSPFWVRDIHKPPLGNHSKEQAGKESAISAAFLSDIHLGSKTFLSSQWEKLIRWFNTDPLARTVKYFVLSGDGVDGVGIYPGQERHLSIKDLFKQYGELARILEDVPDWVDVIMLPGNHDAVRPAEPQPALDPEVQQDYSNTVFVGNPCDFSLHGVRILSYHGKSIDDFVATLRSVTYSKPEMAMRAMLERRHLAPSWGGKTPLSPEPEDRLVIPVIPDIFVTGHVHGHFVGSHKGTTIVHSSTWQDQTDFQRMLGFQPKPCILTVVNLHTYATASIPFA